MTADPGGAGNSRADRHWLGLADRAVVVTGAASGIGRQIAESLAAAGARVALLDLKAEAAQQVAREITASGGQAFAFGCNMARDDEVLAAAEQVRAHLGPVHGLVNNAGFVRPGSLESLGLAAWNQVLAVNLTGYLSCARAFIADLKACGNGSMVHVASISGLFPQTNSGAYSASKAGVRLLSQQMAAEWGRFGVRSNVVCPGLIRTPLTEPLYARPGVESRRAAVTASRRVGVASDIAEPVLYLLSDRAAYVNGAELVVDGGLSCMLMDMVPRPGFNEA